MDQWFCLEIQRCGSGLSVDGCSEVVVMELYLGSVVVLLVWEPCWANQMWWLLRASVEAEDSILSWFVV